MAGPVGRAPPRERPASQFAAGCLDQLRVLAEVPAVQRQCPGEAVLADAVGVAPPAGAGDDHRAGRLAPPLGAPELDPTWGGSRLAGAHPGASSVLIRPVEPELVLADEPSASAWALAAAARLRGPGRRQPR